MKNKRKIGLFAQIYILIAAGIIIVGSVTYGLELKSTRTRVRNEVGELAAQVADELISTVKEYPAYRWLIQYWYAHAGELDVEYDVDFGSGTVTEEKARILRERQPDLQLHYCTEEELSALPDEDQKLYAEIVYSWLITRINESKRNLKPDYLFCVVTDTEEGEHPYGTQTFLLSGAGEDSVRGTNYEEVYTLGVSVEVDKDNTRKSMMKAVELARENGFGRDRPSSPGEELRDAGNYVDYYSCLDIIDDHAVLAGATYSLTGMLSVIRTRTRWGTVNDAICQILLLGLVMTYLFLFVLQPLRDILRNIRLYTDTKDSATVEGNLTKTLSGRKAFAIRRNEIGQLGEDFIDLTKEIRDYVEQIRKVTSEKERYKVELDVASGIQAHMLPNQYPAFPERTEFDLYASMSPAREVGGDFYDYFLIDDDHLALIVADVSDKGVPAALFMVVARTLIRNRAQMGEEPADILYHVNNQLCENNEFGFFVTVWLAVTELSTGNGKAANAGHEHPCICRKDGSYELEVYKHSPAVGVMEDIHFRQHDFKLNPGDRIFVYTDGVPEACNVRNEQFGTDRMLEALNRNPGAAPYELLHSVKKEIDEFAGEAPQFDDTTMLCLSYTGPGMPITEPKPEEEENT